MNYALILIKYGKIWDSMKREEKEEILVNINIREKYIGEFSCMKWEELHPNTKWSVIDYLELKEKKGEPEEIFDFARMTLTVKSGYQGEVKETTKEIVMNLLNDFQQQAREKGFMFGISSFKMENN
jgi:hypothetical protein